jgi:glycosyltransferase involved in cell wall biosynthesis
VARASLFTLDPTAGGGIPALARALYDVMEATGHTPELVYRATEAVPLGSRLRVLAHCLTYPPFRRVLHDGRRGLAMTAYPTAPRRQYHLLRLARAAIAAPIAAVVSGSSHVGLPLALARRPYLVWAAALYGDELRGRVEAGDPWATRMLDGRDWPYLQAQEALVYQQARVIVGTSPHTAARIAHTWPALGDKIRTIVCPVDTQRFQPGPAPADPPYLLLTARIRDPRKNVALLLRAFARVRKAFPAARLVVAGDAPFHGTARLATDLGVEATTTFVGHVAAERLPALYQGATLFVLPSTQEGLGISVEEAMACGLPVVSTRCGGPEGLVQDGVTGVLVPSRDERSLADAVVALLLDRPRREAMGRAARAHALQHFARGPVDEALAQALRATLGERA